MHVIEIDIVDLKNNEWHTISAFAVVKHLAIHKTWTKDKDVERGWTVTHIPTGTAVFIAIDEIGDATDAAKWFADAAEKCGADLDIDLPTFKARRLSKNWMALAQARHEYRRSLYDGRKLHACAYD